jgi:hypothetical protein
MRSLRLLLVLGAAVLATACDSEGDITLAEHGPQASIRFVNAVNDSGPQDWRFVDAVEDSPTQFGLAYRGIFPGAGYLPVAAGSRHLRIFQSWNPGDPTTATPAVVTKVFFDTTFTFEEGAKYTIIAAGGLRSTATTRAKLYLLKDNVPDPGSSIALRTINVAADAASVDFYTAAPAGTAPSLSAVAFGTSSNYVTLGTAPSITATATTAGSKTSYAQAAVPAGLPGDQLLNLTPVGGTTQAGSVITAFVFGAAVTNTPPGFFSANPTNAAALRSAAIVYAVDKHPPRGW